MEDAESKSQESQPLATGGTRERTESRGSNQPTSDKSFVYTTSTYYSRTKRHSSRMENTRWLLVVGVVVVVVVGIRGGSTRTRVKCDIF